MVVNNGFGFSTRANGDALKRTDIRATSTSMITSRATRYDGISATGLTRARRGTPLRDLWWSVSGRHHMTPSAPSPTSKRRAAIRRYNDGVIWGVCLASLKGVPVVQEGVIDGLPDEIEIAFTELCVDPLLRPNDSAVVRRVASTQLAIATTVITGVNGFATGPDECPSLRRPEQIVTS